MKKRIPISSIALMFVCCVCCIVKDLCDGLVISSEESYSARVRACVCDIKETNTKRPRPNLGCEATYKIWKHITRKIFGHSIDSSYRGHHDSQTSHNFAQTESLFDRPKHRWHDRIKANRKKINMKVLSGFTWFRIAIHVTWGLPSFLLCSKHHSKIPYLLHTLHVSPSIELAIGPM
jgi:hypothetical protein